MLVWFRLAVRSHLDTARDVLNTRIEEMQKCLVDLQDEMDFAADVLWVKEMYCRQKVVSTIKEACELNQHLKESAAHLQLVSQAIRKRSHPELDD